MHFHGQTSIAGKCTEGVDGRMDEDAGQQAAATIKNRDQQETHCNCKDNLTQIAYYVHAAAVEQVYQMPNTKSHAGYDDCRFYIILCDSHKQKTSENHFLQKSNAKHTHDTANRFRQRVIYGDTVPEVS